MEVVTIEDVKRDVDRNTEAIGKIIKFLFGNGDAGMDETIRTTCKAVEELSKSFEEYKTLQKESEKYVRDKRDKLQFIVIGALVTNGIAFVATVLYWMIKIAPILHELEALN